MEGEVELVEADQSPTSPAPERAGDRWGHSGDAAASEGALERASGRERADRGGGRVGAGRGLDSSPTEPGKPIWSGWTSWAQPIVSLHLAIFP
jgi:hypothetical protein